MMSSSAAVTTAQRAGHISPTPANFGEPVDDSATGSAAATLIGRERETQSVVELLRDSDARLVVLTGPGGVGKTRLALHVADVLDEAFPDGVWFIPLAPIADHELVIPTIARALGLWDGSQLSLHARLENLLTGRRTLLVLDNVEQVVDAAPQLIELLAACPELHILVTSRSVLRVSGEHDVAVSPLPIDASEHEPAHLPANVPDAVRLFVMRAQAVRPDFALTDDNAGDVRSICHRLDGLPLAIELAAAQVSSLAPSALLNRLDRRLQTLATDAPDTPERLRTMRNTIAWSYDLLDPSYRLVFRQVSVFVGGFSIDAMRAVAGSIEMAGDDEWGAIDRLAGLMDHSFITQAEGPENEPRFSMLETIREYGLERLAESGEGADVRARHARWCVDLARQIATEFEYRRDSGWRDRLEAEHANFRAALRWLLDQGDVETFLELAVALHPLWYHVGHTREGVDWLQAGIARADRAPVATVLQAMLAASEMLGEQCRHDAANDLAERAATLAREAGASQPLAEALYIVGKNAQLSGKEAEGRARIVESLELLDAIGETSRAVHVRTYLAMLGPGGGSHHLSDPAELKVAQDCWETELEMFREQGNMIGITQAIHGLAYAVYLGNDYTRSLALSHDALRLRWSMGDIRFIPAHFEDIGDITLASGQTEQAVRLYSAADTLRERLDTPIPWWFQQEYQREIDASRRALPSAQFDRAWRDGRNMPLKIAVDEALAVRLPEPGKAAAEAAQLTRRERQVLRLMVDGRTNAEIAAELSISWKTVARHVSSILSRLNVESRTAAVSHAVRSNLLLAPASPRRSRSRSADRPVEPS